MAETAKRSSSTASDDPISDPQTPPLIDLLTLEQQELLAQKLWEVIQEEYGDVTIQVVKGKPRFIAIASSFELSK